MKTLLRVLHGEEVAQPPLWLMRQAGRYLPEYRALRAQAGDFMALALNPAWASEVTLQPLRRFGMDGAILFSDILMVPYALGQEVRFAQGEGPVLPPVREGKAIAALEKNLAGLAQGRVSPVFEALALLKPQVGPATLLGFAGAPWTVATYMIEGGSSRDFAQTFALRQADPQAFDALIKLLVQATIDYLDAQVQAGAEAVQIFDSWASALPDDESFKRYCVAPIRAIAQGLKQRHPQTPIIAFPRGITLARLAHFVSETQGLVAGVSLGYDQKLSAFTGALAGHKVVLQGNYSPEELCHGSAEEVYQAVRAMLVEAQGWSSGYIANLGHGVLPSTPVENVAALVRAVRGD